MNNHNLQQQPLLLPQPWGENTKNVVNDNASLDSLPSFYLFVPLTLGIVILSFILLLYVSSLAICPTVIRTNSVALRTTLFRSRSSTVVDEPHVTNTNNESIISLLQRTYRIYSLRGYIYGQRWYSMVREWLWKGYTTLLLYSFHLNKNNNHDDDDEETVDTQGELNNEETKNIPLFMVVNAKSGGGLGTLVQQICQESIPSSKGGPLDVVPLTVTGLHETLRRLLHLTNHIHDNEKHLTTPPTIHSEERKHPIPLYPRLICAGGDGTVSAIVRTMMEKGINPVQIPLVILPLGTGNDIGNSLHMNKIQPQFNPVSLQRWFRKVRQAPVKMIDVWSVSFGTFPEGSIHILRNGSEVALPEKEVRGTSILYTSIGIDAQLVWNVERNRQKKRWLNKLLYFLIGSTLSLFGWFLNSLTPTFGDCYFPQITLWLRQFTGKGLGSYISSVTVDNISLAVNQLPSSLYSILAISSYSYGGGTNLWPHTWSLGSNHYQRLYGTRSSHDTIHGNSSNSSRKFPEWLQRATESSSSNASSLPRHRTIGHSFLYFFSYLFGYSWWRSSSLYPPNEQPSVQATASPYSSIMNRILFYLNQFEPWLPQSMTDQTFELLGSNSLFSISGIIGTKTGILGGIYRLGQPRSLFMEFQRPPLNAQPPVLYIPTTVSNEKDTSSFFVVNQGTKQNHYHDKTNRRPSYTSLSIYTSSSSSFELTVPSVPNQSTFRKTLITTPYRVLRSMGLSLKEKARTLRTKSSSLRKPRTIMVAEPELVEDEDPAYRQHQDRRQFYVGTKEEGYSSSSSSSYVDESSSSSSPSDTEKKSSSSNKEKEVATRLRKHTASTAFFPDHPNDDHEPTDNQSVPLESRTLSSIVVSTVNPVFVNPSTTGIDGASFSSSTVIPSSNVDNNALSTVSFPPYRESLQGVRSNRHRSTSISSSSPSRIPVVVLPSYPPTKQIKGYATLHRSQLPNDETAVVGSNVRNRSEENRPSSQGTLPLSIVPTSTGSVNEEVRSVSILSSSVPIVPAIRIPQITSTSSSSSLVTDNMIENSGLSPNFSPSSETYRNIEPSSTPGEGEGLFSPPVTYPPNYYSGTDTSSHENEGIRARHIHHQPTVVPIEPLKVSSSSLSSNVNPVSSSSPLVSSSSSSVSIPAGIIVPSSLTKVPMTCIYIQVDGEAYRVYGLRYIQITYAGQTAMVHINKE